MKQLEGRTAFVTGGGSGIGLSMARAFGEAGMNVVLADIDSKAIEAALGDLHERQVKAFGVECDVASRTSVERAAQETLDQYGKVHVVCSVGVDLDLMSYVSDVQRMTDHEVLVVLPRRDRVPITEELLGLLRRPIRIHAID